MKLLSILSTKKETVAGCKVYSCLSILNYLNEFRQKHRFRSKLIRACRNCADTLQRRVDRVIWRRNVQSSFVEESLSAPLSLVESDKIFIFRMTFKFRQNVSSKSGSSKKGAGKRTMRAMAAVQWTMRPWPSTIGL